MASSRQAAAEVAERPRHARSASRRRSAALRWLCSAVLLCAPVHAFAQTASAQTRASRAERIRTAAALEAVGDFEGAERILDEILRAEPTSLNALIAYERVLGILGRPEALIVALERLLTVDAGSAIAHQMRLRTYGGIGDESALTEAVDAWITVTPHLETPYREAARAWRGLGRVDRAVAILEQGSARIDRADALALELGDAHLEAGDVSATVRQWDRAIGPDAAGLMLVQRRLAGQPNGGAGVIPGLVSALTRAPTSRERRRAATQLAIAAGLEAQAGAIAESLAAELDGAARESFVVEVARNADGAGLSRLAYWAYRQLLSEDRPEDQLRAVRARAAELALELGDTASAAAGYRALEFTAEPGSVERRQAGAMRIQLTAREGDAYGAADALASYRKEFPEAPELDGVIATVANALLDIADTERARTALAGATGPRAGLIRARLMIHDGNVKAGRRELLRSAPGLHGAEATEAISLATMLGRISAPAAERVARGIAMFAEGDAPGAVDWLLTANEAQTGEDRAAMLNLAARLADRAALTARAATARHELVTEFPMAREAPAALLSLAQSMMRRGAPADDIEALLERLIFEHPRSALVPQARREIDRLRGQPASAGVGAGGSTRESSRSSGGAAPEFDERPSRPHRTGR